jgi:hypothetical protein
MRPQADVRFQQNNPDETRREPNPLRFAGASVEDSGEQGGPQPRGRKHNRRETDIDPLLSVDHPIGGDDQKQPNPK